MNLVGTGNRLSPDALVTAARAIGCESAAIAAVRAVEAPRGGFDAKHRLTALFEPHKFYKHLGAGKPRDLAVRKGLAYARWKPGNYPKTSDGVYAQVVAACAIDETAALKSVSWGLGQTLGENFLECGYPTVQAMVAAYQTGEDEQLVAMIRLVKAKGLDDELRRKDWAGFARGWNGSGYRANRYDDKLAEAYARFASPSSAPPTPRSPSVIAQLGDHGGTVGEVQGLLTAAGHRVVEDQDFGPSTKRQVRLFQLDRGLPGTGVVDVATLAALREAPAPEIAHDRENATAEDLKGKSTIVSLGGQVQKIALAAAGSIGAAKGSDKLGLLDQAQDLTSKIDGAKGVFESVNGVFSVVADNWWVVAVVCLVGLAYLATRIVAARVKDHNTGRTL